MPNQKRRHPAKKKRASRSRLLLKLLALLTLTLAIFLGAFLIHYYYVFNGLIEQKLKNQSQAATTEIFASPAMLFPGKGVSRDDLFAQVRRLGYELHDSPAGVDRSYCQVLADRLLIHNDTAAPASPGAAAEITFSGNRIRSLTDVNSGKSLDRFALKPQLLSNLITSEREKRRFVRYRELPSILINAVLAAEDKRFFSHSGVDPIRIVRAFVIDVREGGMVQGASTLTQQFVKNYFLTPERTLKRKLTDAYMSILLERRLSKEQIFELWANEVYLGQRGSFSIVGFGQAAEAYFAKGVKDLTLGEAATLAAIIPAPNRYAPFRHPDRAKARRDLVLDLMAQDAMISPGECDAAKAQPLDIKPGTAMNYSDAPYFVDYVQEYLDEKLGADDSLSRLHYKVFTTLDAELQKAAYEALREGLAEVDEALEKGPRAIPPGTVQASLIAVDPRNGQILAMIGGRNYGSSQYNRITQSKRQPGSIFKPLVYAAALETAYNRATPLTPISAVLDAPAQFPFDDLLYEPRNYKDEYLGQVTMRQAVAKSLNIATIRFAERVGLEKIVKMAIRLGLNEEIKPYPAVAIGSFEVTPLEMVRAYTAFANGGLLSDLMPVASIVDARGKALFTAESKSTRAISPQVAFMITSLLQSVVNEGTGAGVRSRGFSMPAAGKTGTSHDGWFAGYTPRLLCISWVGFDDNRELNLPGSRAALPIWVSFMKRAAAIRPLRGEPFPIPEDIVSVEVDPTTGYLATEQCMYRQTEYFIKGTEPVLPCYGNNYAHAVSGVPTSIYSTLKESPRSADKNSTPPEAKKPPH